VFALGRTSLKEPVLAGFLARKSISSAACSRRRGRRNTVSGRAIGITNRSYTVRWSSDALSLSKGSPEGAYRDQELRQKPPKRGFDTAFGLLNRRLGFQLPSPDINRL
jgi:hypothetical protein